MATNFPTSLDSYDTKVDSVTDVVAADINDPQDAIEALEAKVGIDGSAVTTSHDYLLSHRMSKEYVKVSDVKAYNVDGGGLIKDAWRTRDINTEDSDVYSICSIGSNQITLEAGTYLCSIIVPAYNVGRNVARLYNISDTSVAIIGTVGYSATIYGGFSHSIIKGLFTIAAQKIFEVQHYSLNSATTSGFGLSTNISGVNSIYTVAEFWRM